MKSRLAWCLLLAVVVLCSCTGMPTAPPLPISVEGRITGPAGEPMIGASISFVSTASMLNGYGGARADSTGSYSLQLHAGTYSVVVFPPSGISTPTRRATVKFTDKRSRYDVSFQGFRVTGRVTDPLGMPLDGGGVSASGPDHQNAFSRLASASYSLLLPAGTYALSAADSNYWSGFSRQTLNGVSIASDTTIDIPLGGNLVSGIVTGPDGLPMGDVRVEAGYTAQNITRADGSYRLYLPSGDYRIQFYPPYPFYIVSRVSDLLTINGPATVNCDLSGVEWKGIVRRQGTGDPAPGVTVAVYQAAVDFGRGAAISSGPQGEFRFILERGHSYGLETYDPSTGQRAVAFQSLAATADTTFDVSVP